jgi:hypothetical protein
MKHQQKCPSVQPTICHQQNISITHTERAEVARSTLLETFDPKIHPNCSRTHYPQTLLGAPTNLHYSTTQSWTPAVLTSLRNTVTEPVLHGSLAGAHIHSFARKTPKHSQPSWRSRLHFEAPGRKLRRNVFPACMARGHTSLE